MILLFVSRNWDMVLTKKLHYQQQSSHMSYRIWHGAILINFKRLTGKGTSHWINYIAIQARVYGPYLPATEVPCIQNNKQRSVGVEHRELEVYVTVAHVGSQCLVTMESCSQEP